MRSQIFFSKAEMKKIMKKEWLDRFLNDEPVSFLESDIYAFFNDYWLEDQAIIEEWNNSTLLNKKEILVLNEDARKATIDLLVNNLVEAQNWVIANGNCDYCQKPSLFGKITRPYNIIIGQTNLCLTHKSKK